MDKTETWLRPIEPTAAPAAPQAARVAPESDDRHLRIGPYRIIRCLGSGGMAEVYLAEREDFEKRVAIKVTRRGLGSDQEFVQRFKNERQILARLEHPSIARLLDGGTDAEQRPYLVMEYVKGRQIDDYCRDQDLSVDDRVELIRKVCRAVHFAHQNLLVHRDLKPSNVLVNESGEPKLLDFGIAKILDPALAGESVVTGPQRGLMTLRYASPEQIRFEPISVASDVYSLGVMLYELLTGASPYGEPAQSGGHPLSEAICRVDPRPPSAVLKSLIDGAGNLDSRSAAPKIRRIRGDLDSIVLRALRKDPQDRYGSAQELEQDLGRFTAGLPVHAASPSWLDHLVKFARRHTLSVTAVALVLIMILSFTVVSFQLMRRAENEATEKQEVVELVQELFQQAGPRADDGSPKAAYELLANSQGLINRHLDNEAQIELLSTLGQTFWDAGQVDEADLAFRGALRAARAAFGPDHAKVLAALADLALLSYLSGDYRSCELHSRAILEARKRNGTPEGPLHWDDLSGLASALLMQGKLDGVEAMFLEVLAKRSQGLDNPKHQLLAASHKQLAGFYYTVNELDAARRHVEASLSIWQAKEETRHLGPTAATLDLAGRIHLASGNLEQAQTYLSRALQLRQTHALGPIPIARTRRHLAELRWLQGDADVAESLLGQALDTFDAFDEQSWIRDDAMSLKGELMLHGERPDLALEVLRDAHARLEQIRGPDALVTRQASARLQAAYRLSGRDRNAPLR